MSTWCKIIIHWFCTSCLSFLPRYFPSSPLASFPPASPPFLQIPPISLPSFFPPSLISFIRPSLCDPSLCTFLYIDLHPCISVTCQYYGQCQASSPLEAHCACNTHCPTFEDQICGSNGETYQNHCFYKLDVCQTRTNITVLHNGSCYGEYLYCLKIWVCDRKRFGLR